MAPRSDASSSCSPARSRSRSRSRSKSRSPTPRRSPVRDTDSEAGRPTSRRQLSPRSPSRTLSRGRSRSRSGSPHPRHQSGDGRSRSRSFRPPSRSRPRSHSRSHSPAHAPLRSPTPAVPEPSATDKIEQNEAAKQAALKVEYQKLMDLRSGGTYIPPARLRALQAQLGQDDSEESKRIQQKFHWEALKKAINGLINKCNVSNIKHIVPELFEENLVRGRGLLCRSLMKAQAASLGFTPVFAVLAAAVNSRLPQVGELLVSRLILQFRKAFKRNDKKVCLASTTFLAHLTNQQVVHEFVALQILLLLLNKPTDDSVEIAVGFMKEVGEFLSDMQPRPVMLVWDRFREILHEGEIDKRVQYAVEVLFQIRKDNFRDNPAIKEELDIMEEEDMITHKLSLDDDDLKTQDNLNIFKFDPDFEASEAAYKRLKAEILGEASGSEDDDDDDEDESSDEEEGEEKQMEIKDQSNADLVNLRRTIYLTIKSSMDPEEAVHKLIRVKIPAGLEHELPSMVMECCAQEHTYQKFFGLIGERFAKLNRMWTDLFENQFATTFETIHRFETNRLRNVARFFGHMFAFDALGWHIFNVINLNEEETTASSRIFIKILFQDIAEIIGMKKLRERLEDPNMQEYYEGIFPKDNARNVRFSINYFTSIGMGPITESMREYLVNMPKPALPAIPAIDYSDGESVSSYSSYSSRSRSRSRSITPKNRGRSHSRTHSRSISVDSRSRSRSRSYSRSPPRSRSRTPKRARRRSYSRSRSRSYSRSPSRSRSRPRSRSPVTTKSKSTASSSRRHNGSYSRSRNHGRGRSVSYDSRRSGSRSRSRSISRSKSPVVRKQSGKGRRRSPSSSRSHSRLLSRSRTPVRNSASGKRRRAASPSKSPSPPPSKRGRR